MEEVRHALDKDRQGLTRVHLEGSLKRYGKHYDLAIDRPAEAVTALSVQIKGFRQAIEAGQWIVFNDDRDIGEDELNMRAGRSIRIVPAPTGAGGKSGIFQVILGITLVAVAFMLPATAPAILSSFLTTVGTGLILSGVASMFTPTVKGPETEEERKSFLFGSTTNVTTAGDPIPVVYGRLRVGSLVVSSGLTAEDVPDAED